jgi:signal transduction histidine kinase
VRPLDRLTSIKAKLGAVIVIAVAVTVVTVVLGSRSDRSILARGVVAGSVSLLMVQVMARGMTSPLREMAAAARAMAAGDYGRRVTATSRDEVGELARAFNRMAGELAEVDRMRRDLVANVSHELRTPITALRAVLENLVDGVEPPDPATLQTLLRQVERLGRLVEQLLDLSRLESGAAPLDRSVFAVAPFVEQSLHEARVAADLAGVTIELTADVQPTDLRADADEERAHQVLANLLGNAVRHSPPGGCVAVRARRAHGRLLVEVADEGAGIPPDEASRVFERFYRTDTSRAASDGGTGLGLSIARWIVELHGGDLRVEQNEPTGCRMVVEIPQGDT